MAAPNSKLPNSGSSAAKASNKQVVYVDVDDEITAVIDKINEADAKVVALVLPKRATVFQSIVNMKLLKRRAEQAGKHLVLITSEASLMPLAGMAGVYIAATLQSKPEVPAATGSPDDSGEDDNEAVALDGGEVAPAAGAKPANLPDDVEELDMAAPANASKPAPAMAAMAAGGAAANKTGEAVKGKDKKLKVPDFLRFRKKLIFAGLGLVALIVLWYFAFFVMPAAQITVKTKTADISTSTEITLDTAATEVDTNERTVPAKMEQQKKDQTQQTPATGQDNKGNKATGQVRLTNCSKSGDGVTIPAGSGVSANGMTFLTQASVTLGSSSFDFQQNCKSTGDSSATVNVVAQKPGASYNLAASDFAVAGISSVEAKSNDPMTGGTDNIVKVVQQSDIDAAKAKIESSDEKDSISKELQSSLKDAGYEPITNSLHIDAADVVASTKVGEEAEAVTVSQSTTYYLYGAKKDDLRKIIESEVKDKIDKDKQSIIDDGLDDAKFSFGETNKTPQVKATMIDTATAGPKLDLDKTKQAIVGKKSNEIKTIIKANPGVEDVTVKYSPFWVNKAPKPAKTTIVFEKSGS